MQRRKHQFSFICILLKIDIYALQLSTSAEESPQANSYRTEIELQTNGISPLSVFMYPSQKSFVTLLSGRASPYSIVPIPWPVGRAFQLDTRDEHVTAI